MNDISKKQKILLAILATAITVAATIFFIHQKPPVQVSQQAQVAIPPKTQPATTKIAPKKPKKIVIPETIKGDIITLKKYHLRDAFEYYQMFSPKVRKFFEFPEKITFSYVEYRLNYDIDKMNKGLLIAYTIWDNAAKRLVGSIQIKEKNDEDPGQLSMWLNENFWGGGRIQEALKLATKTYFDLHPEHDHYIAFVRQWNPRSLKTLLKFGFKKVGETTYNDEVANVYKITRKDLKN